MVSSNVELAFFNVDTSDRFFFSHAYIAVGLADLRS